MLGDIPTKTYHFLFDPTHTAFQSITMTPRDALLTHLAFLTGDQTRTTSHSPDMARILADFRETYGTDTALDLKALPGDAAAVLTDVARSLVAACLEEDRASLFNDLHVDDQTSVMRALAGKKIKPTDATSNGAFLASAPFEVLQGIVAKRPELTFDGKVWSTAYADLDYGKSEITAEARASVLARYEGLMSDAIWLSKQDSGDLGNHPREEIIRAVMSLALLRPDVETEA